MAVTNTKRRDVFNGNGASLQFNTTFVFIDPASVKAAVDGVVLPFGSGYTVVGGQGSTGTVTFINPPPAGIANVVLYREEPNTQRTDNIVGGAFSADVQDLQYDRLVLQIQDIREELTRALKIPVTHTSPQFNTNLPDPGNSGNVGPNGLYALSITPTGYGIAQIENEPSMTTVQSYTQGQCQLQLVGANVTLFPFNGNILTLKSAGSGCPCD